MADEAKPKPEKQEAKPKRKLPKTALLVGGVAIGEAILFAVVAMLFSGPPQATHGAEDPVAEEPNEALAQTINILLVENFRVPNAQDGRLYIYDLTIWVVVPGDKADELKTLVVEREPEISDRVARIVRAAEPAVLREPGLANLRKQMLHELVELFGDETLFVEVLIPRCLPNRAD